MGVNGVVEGERGRERQRERQRERERQKKMGRVEGIHDHVERGGRGGEPKKG